MKIKVRLINPNCRFEFIDKGEWIDLKAAETVEFSAPYANTLNGNRTKRDVVFDYKLINLGFAMKLPKGFEAIVTPRSGTFKNYGIIMTNSQGIIDSSYSGTNDEWKFPAIAFKDIMILEGDRICQFRIQLNQKATFWQKLKWLFSSGVEFVFVDDLNNNARSGLGSTGI